MIFNKTYDQRVREGELEELRRLRGLRAAEHEAASSVLVPALGEDKTNQADEVLPAAEVVFRVTDVQVEENAEAANDS